MGANRAGKGTSDTATETPGEIAGRQPRPGDIAACQPLPGRAAYSSPSCNGMVARPNTEDKNSDGKTTQPKNLDDMSPKELDEFDERIKGFISGNPTFGRMEPDDAPGSPVFPFSFNPDAPPPKNRVKGRI